MEGNEPRKYTLTDRSPNLARRLTGLALGQQLTDAALHKLLSLEHSNRIREFVDLSHKDLSEHSQPDSLVDSLFGQIYSDGNKYVHLSGAHIHEICERESLLTLPRLKTYDAPSGNEDTLKCLQADMAYVTLILVAEVKALFQA